jgi:sterol desaturase/sphingolipid hydroxylase (fatty acid hydroxylase superfamily)
LIGFFKCLVEDPLKIKQSKLILQSEQVVDKLCSKVRFMTIQLPGLGMENGFLRAWWFEPLVATSSFTLAIHLYWYEERRRGLSRNNRLLDTFVLEAGDHYHTLGAYWLGIWLLKCVIQKPDLPDGIPTDLESVLNLLAEVVAGICMYDALFFFVHWAMHEIPFLRNFHMRHHDVLENTLEARDVLRHSVLDGALQVLCNIIVQQANPWGSRKSRCARVLHNVIVTWMLTESHTSSPSPNIWRRFCVGVREHRLHHLGILKSDSYGRFHRHQQFFGYLDNLRAWMVEQHHRYGTRTIRASCDQESKAKNIRSQIGCILLRCRPTTCE